MVLSYMRYIYIYIYIGYIKTGIIDRLISNTPYRNETQQCASTRPQQQPKTKKTIILNNVSYFVRAQNKNTYFLLLLLSIFVSSSHFSFSLYFIFHIIYSNEYMIIYYDIKIYLLSIKKTKIIAFIYL